MPSDIDRELTNTTKTRVYEWNGKPVEITMEYPQELELLPNGIDIIESMFADAFDKVKNGTDEYKPIED